MKSIVWYYFLALAGTTQRPFARAEDGVAIGGIGGGVVTANNRTGLTRVEQQGASIIGGGPAAFNQFPGYAHPAGAFLCGGQLVAPDVVLTAGHCDSAWAVGTTGSYCQTFRRSRSCPYSIFLFLSLNCCDLINFHLLTYFLFNFYDLLCFGLGQSTSVAYKLMVCQLCLNGRTRATVHRLMQPHDLILASPFSFRL